ncbi:MAG TPA: AIR synthase-related protein, partial [Stellaceae bacterium]
SLYNETNGKGILPTPAIGGVGLIDDAAKSVSLAFKRAGDALILIGETRGHLGCSLYLRELFGREDGAPPPVDLAAERRNGKFVRAEIAAGRVAACHDLSDGGLLVALAEMAMAGRLGATIGPPSSLPIHMWAFGEDQARYLVETADPEQTLHNAKAAGVPAVRIGAVTGDQLTVSGAGAISVVELRQINESWFPAYMAAP